MKSFAIFFSALLICATVYSGEPITFENQNILIQSTSAEATILRGTGEEVPAAKGVPCQLNDVIKTGPESTLDVKLNRVAGVRLLPDSQLKITGRKEKSMSLWLQKGNVIFNVKKLPENTTFKVETPTAVAAVRGTQFWGMVDPKGSRKNPHTTFAVRDGSVEILIKKSGKKVLLNAGEAVDFGKKFKKMASRAASAEEMAAMSQADAIVIAS